MSDNDEVQVSADQETPEDETVAMPHTPNHPASTDEAEVDEVGEVPAEEVAAPAEEAA